MSELWDASRQEDLIRMDSERISRMQRCKLPPLFR